MLAKFKRLPNQEWGISVYGQVSVGDVVEVEKKDGETIKVVVTDIVEVRKKYVVCTFVNEEMAEMVRKKFCWHQYIQPSIN